MFTFDEFYIRTKMADTLDRAMLDCMLYGTGAYFVTTGPDKPQHIFAGRNDIGDTMTKYTREDFDKAYSAAHSTRTGKHERITLEQAAQVTYSAYVGNQRDSFIEHLLECVVEDKPAPAKLNVHDVPLGTIMYYCGDPNHNQGYHGVEITVVETPGGLASGYTYGQRPGATWDGAFRVEELTTDITKSVGYVPPKPKRLPIERPVRIKDVEVGDVLIYCGVDDDHESWPVIGSEVVVTGTVNRYGNLQYTCTNKRGEIIKEQNAPEYCIAQGFSFVRRPGFAKVRDGYVKAGDTCWWLSSMGPESFTVDNGDGSSTHRSNMEYAPWCYQKAEPKVIIEHGSGPKARYAYLETDYATKLNDHDGQPL